jgi:hypothetical protein
MRFSLAFITLECIQRSSRSGAEGDCQTMNSSSSTPVSQLRLALHRTRATCPGKLAHLRALSLFLCTLAMTRCVAAQSPSGDSTQTAAAMRPCAPAALESTPAEKAKHPDGAPANTQKDIPPSCLEVRATTLDIQDYLKTLVREKRWTIAQAQTSGDSFSFYRLLDKDELAQVARTEILGGRVTWTEGKAFVMARLTDAGDGFARVIISARIQGRGQSSEHFARPSDLWPLVSKGTLESAMIAALESHFRSQH